MNIISIVGIGSPFGDDRVGWEVIKLLEKNENIQKNHSNIHLSCCERLGIDLFEQTQDANQIILIDAVKTGAAIGTCHQFHLNEIEQLYSSISTHGLGIGYFVKLMRELQSVPPNIILYGIEIDKITHQQNLSLPVKEAAMKLFRLLKPINSQ